MMFSERLLPEREILPELEQLDYEIIEWIPTKSNGMARLVKARSQSGDLVAIKIARVTEPDALTDKHNRAIIAEAACLQKLSHCPGVVPILPVYHRVVNAHGVEQVISAYYGSLNGEGAAAYLVQSFLPGSTLSRFVGNEPLDPIVALQIAYRLADTLTWIHGAQWVHRDLKPSNIMMADAAHEREQKSQLNGQGLSRKSDPLDPTLIDFGIAVPSDEQVMAEGTLSWMAPEVRKAFDENRQLTTQPASDIYGLGLILCYMLLGQRPDSSRSCDENRRALRDSSFQRISATLSSNTKAIRSIESLLHDLLNEEPNKRPTARVVSNRIAKILKMLNHPLPTLQSLVIPKKRFAIRPLRIVGAILVTVVSMFIGLQLFVSSSQELTESGMANQSALLVSATEAASEQATPSALFPFLQEAPTATLLPAAQEAFDAAINNSNGADSATVLRGQVDAQNMVAQANALASIDGSTAGSDATEGSVTDPDEESSFFAWLPEIQLPSTIQNLFTSETPTPTPEPTAQPTATIVPASPVGADLAVAVEFPQSAKVLEIVGNQYACKERWQESVTWNKSVRGSRINLRWQQIGELPFDAEARYVVAVAVDKAQLTPEEAAPISHVLTGNGIDIDAVEVFWTMNRFVPRNRIVNEPYVWGVFLIDNDGRMVTRVSPICYFQLDGELARSVSDE